MKILITGGAGFIGSNFIRWWLKNHPEDEILNLDLLTYAGNRENLKDIETSPRYKFVKGDVADPEIVKKAVKEAEAIFHFAAESHVTRSEKHPDLFYRTNVLGTENLLKQAQKTRAKKFIHISTDEVYGPIIKGFYKEEDKKKGNHQATSAYAKSKSLADDLAMEYNKKVPVIVVRPSNNFGPYQYPEKALPRWITNLLEGTKIPLWGKGEQIRDWLYVEDTARGIELIFEKGKIGEAYNLAANNEPEITNRQAAEWLVEILGLSKEHIEHVPDPRPQHDFRYGIDTAKIKKLGFETSAHPKEHFRKTAQWYEKNPKWWKKLKKAAEAIYK